MILFRRRDALKSDVQTAALRSAGDCRPVSRGWRPREDAVGRCRRCWGAGRRHSLPRVSSCHGRLGPFADVPLAQA